MNLKKALFAAVLLLSVLSIAVAFDSEDYKLFDLNDRLVALKGKTATFYNVLQIKPDAKPSEIGKAYRKISLGIHPDKNPSEEDRKLYELLTSIASTLKDSEERERYDRYLQKGFPTWRGTGYYYNHWKPGFVTLSLLAISGISIVQYITKVYYYYQEVSFRKQELQRLEGLSYTQMKKHLSKMGTDTKGLNKKDFKKGLSAVQAAQASTQSGATFDHITKVDFPSIRDTALVQLPLYVLAKVGVKLGGDESAAGSVAGAATTATDSPADMADNKGKADEFIEARRRRNKSSAPADEPSSL
ncbi:uncharacterized protein BJ171DRAFT_488011 [Polychytrium aggregatum]|uniref:uncharacterized protein n=1 Tax=Polychytrium aggregatum TaxID=110093 RepID=UPI0022FF35E6|nr:uncharacterized protein BJ171DRAFT_488011 [Polychytrium aggregatum]KAI9208977.1 hypothetical protein BJ171DRAFT_488011 [Polychytrium aggregatum]